MTTSARKRLMPLLLFLVALLPRLPGLGQFITTDEYTNIFIAGSDVLRAFLTGNLRETYWHFYPGVTMSWLTDVGLAAQYAVESILGHTPPPLTEFIYQDITQVLIAARLPFALLTAVSVPVIYGLARKLLPHWAALLGALFIALDPFYLAHSRVNHGDAPVTVVMAVSALALFVAIESIRREKGEGRRETITLPESHAPRPTSKSLSPTSLIFNPYLWLSAIAGGLAALTKAPGQFMALFTIGLALLYAALDWRTARQSQQNYGLRITGYWLAVVAIWGLVSLATFILLWPAMWVDPMGTLWQMLDETFFKVEAGHLVYFLGQPTLDPGFGFYPLVIAFRLTPITLPGVLLSLLLFVPPLRRRSGLFTADGSPSMLFLLWLFVISLWLFGNLSPKKQDRYLLPLFPFLDLLAAVGWLGLFRLIFTLSALTRYALPATRYPPIILLLLHAIPVFTYYPYYLAYFNPLLGGPQRAVETTLIGWGEGMEQAAAYLNAKPNAESLYVAAVPSQTLLPYFAGSGENFYTNDIAFRAEYVVLYISQIQRLAPSPEIVRYFQAQTPEKIIEIAGLPYAKIYATTPRILPDIPPEATPQNIGLGDKIRLAGHIIGPESLSLTLFWHVLAPLKENYTISVRAHAADGRQLAQQDQWPVNGLLPTTQWRQGDTIADTHLLTFAPTDTPLLAWYEVVVYNAETDETLGPPIIIERENLEIRD